MSTGVRLDVDDQGVATITLDRPDAGNSIDMQMATAFGAAVDTIAADPGIRVVTVASTGRIFCGGGDVREMALSGNRGEHLTELASAVHESLKKMDQFEVPVVGAVQGPVAGAGLGLVLACDHVVAARSSSFSAAYAAVGLSPDCGVTAWLPRVVGFRRSLRMLLTAERLDAPAALSAGLVDQVVDNELLSDTVGSVVAAFQSGPHPALGSTRRLVRASYATDLAAQLDSEMRTVAIAGDSDAATERLRRFTGADG